MLRYFNPAEAHVSGMIGEEPSGVWNNLLPFIAQVLVRKRPKLSVFGGYYPTPDSTGRRGHIHVEDLTASHLAALNRLIDSNDDSLITINLGTCWPYSVLETASGKLVPFEIVSRRAGDLAEYCVAPTLASNMLGWQAQLGIDSM